MPQKLGGKEWRGTPRPSCSHHKLEFLMSYVDSFWRSWKEWRQEYQAYLILKLSINSIDIKIRFYCIALGFEKNMKIQPKLLQDTFIDNLQSALNGNKRKH